MHVRFVVISTSHIHSGVKCVCMSLRELSIFFSLVYGGITFYLVEFVAVVGSCLPCPLVVCCCLFVVCIPSLFTGVISRISYESSHWLLW